MRRIALVIGLCLLLMMIAVIVPTSPLYAILMIAISIGTLALVVWSIRCD